AAQPEEELLEPRPLFEADAEVVDEPGPDVLHVEPRGDDVDVVRGAARGEDLAAPVADDAARGREWDLADDVLAGDGPVVVALDDRELEEPDDEAQEDERHQERDPAEPALELADVGAAPLAREAHAGAHAREAHRCPPSPGRGTMMVAAWMRSASAKTKGATM